MSTSIQKSSAWRQKKRLLIDRFAQYGIGFGGLSVILAIVLIFFYLLWVVMPIFSSAEVSTSDAFAIPATDAGETVLIVPEESGMLAMRITNAGQAVFFEQVDGKELQIEELELPVDESITRAHILGLKDNWVVLQLGEDKLFFFRVNYRVSFKDDQRVLTPEIIYPFSDTYLSFDAAILDYTATYSDENLTISMLTRSSEIKLYRYEVEEDDDLPEPEYITEVENQVPVDKVLMGQQALWLYLTNMMGEISVFDISDIEAPEMVSQTNILPPDDKLSDIELLIGGTSLLVADKHGNFRQLSLQRDKSNNYFLNNIRGFKHDHPIVLIQSESRRKGVLMLDDQGKLLIYHTTADHLVAEHALLNDSTAKQFALSPRANVLIVENDKQQTLVTKIHNEHPEISWNALWGKVTYEGYNEPDYIWQSSSADNDFEPKFSLVPLAFGTIKAAFYAMLFATPIAIMGAIYTAYFMSAGMRGWVKPGIEIMEALPTVILGFLAGLWLAPVVENNLLGIISILFVLPPGILLTAILWQKLPKRIHYAVPVGWQAAILMPVIALLVWLAITIAPSIEALLFNDSLRHWMQTELGIGYDQRNSLVVGIAMGLAVIPTIFSITEDAIFSVPKYLTQGSLALGATPWQTLTRVVLLTASPGIFSAVMIGLGRAVGETMIVLMATGNTAVMDFSIFEGMRTLSANVAVELPESEIGSSHYRILFLAALVLFIVTFIFNTAAEIVRQRLRKQYGSL